MKEQLNYNSHLRKMVTKPLHHPLAALRMRTLSLILDAE